MLQVWLLGQFDVQLDGKRIVIPTRAGQSLFAFLLLTAGTPHRREKLAGLLWPNTTDENARNSLRHALWRIRKNLSSHRETDMEYLLAEELTLTFNPQAEYLLDVAQLEGSLAGDASSAELIAKLALYRGELLPGFYDDWAVLERERVRASFETKMRQLMELLIHEQQWKTTLEWAERWIAFGQTPEPAYRSLMVAYAMLGDRSKVGHTMERCRKALATELGVEPSPETHALYDQIARDKKITGVDLITNQVAPARVRASNEPPAPGEPPFKGLEYFDEADAALFVGREVLTAKLVGHLREYRFLAVIVGASGSGKSSIVRAGLVPALKSAEPLGDRSVHSQDSAKWQFHIITPTAHPLEALAASFTRDTESVTATATLIDDLSRNPRSLHLFLKRHPAHALLVVDQFEELFTLCRDSFEREAFIDNLLLAVAPDSGGHVSLVITLRADFYSHLAQYPELRDLVAEHQEYIGPMSTEELRRAIEEPAKRGGWEFELGLVDLFLRDVGDEPGALPLLSHALLETWKRRRGRMLTLKGYAESGGVRGAIAQTAETVYQQLTPAQQAIARNIFLRLTELGEGTEDTRRRASQNELVPHPKEGENVRSVLNMLAEARLITLGLETAEVAHEALIREWPTLREWLAQDREGLRLHRYLTESTHEWELLERDAGALYRGARLAQANEWAQTNPNELNERERTFLQASVEQELREETEREALRQRELVAAQELAETQSHAAKQLRRRAVFLAGAFMLAVVLAFVALLFGDQARASAITAQTSSRVAFARELAASANGALDVDPERSILLALQAVALTGENQTPLLDAQDALHRAVGSSRVLFTMRGHTIGLLGLALNRDSTRLVTLSQDGTAKIWNAATGRELLSLPTGITANILGSGAAFTPDGTRLLTFSKGNTATLWDLATAKPILMLTGHSADVASVAVSSDGKRLATASADKTAKIWDATTGEELFTLAGHTGVLNAVSFSPDSQRVYTGSDDGSARIWDAATGKQLSKLDGPGVAVESIIASPDGTRLATADFDTTVKIWDAATGKLLLTLFGHSSQPVNVAYSADGKYLASASEDGTAKVWDATTSRLLLTLAGHTSGVQGVAFDRDGKRLFTASRDGTAKAWDISSTAGSEWLTLSGHGDRVNDVTFSADGARIATSSYNMTAKIWDASTGKELLSLPGTGVRFSPDGKLLVTGGSDKTTLKIWDAATGNEIRTISGLTASSESISFSLDGTRLAIADGLRTGVLDGTIRIYDTANWNELFKLAGPPEGVGQVAFSPDGARLVSAGFDGIAQVWDTRTGKELLTFSGHKVRLNGATFSPEGKRIATSGNDATVKVWDSSTGVELFTLTGHAGATFGVAFSPDGQQLATSSVDRTVKIWGLPRAGEQVKEPLTLSSHTAAIYRIAFSPDGTRLATASRDGTTRVFALRIQDLAQIARSRLTRTLTTDECQKFLHVEQCPIQP